MKEDSKAPLKAAASQMGGGGQAPAPAVPSVPLVARSVNPKVPIVTRNMLGAVMTVEEPAQGVFPTVTTRLWGELSMDLELGTSRPPKAHVGLDESKKFLFLAPTTKDDPLGVEIRYTKSRASINLLTVFGPLDRHVQPDLREYYDVGITPGKVKFDDGFESVALFVHLMPTKTEPRRTMSEEAKAKLRTTLARKKQQKADAAADNQ